jgi:hypothetical protein
MDQSLGIYYRVNEKCKRLDKQITWDPWQRGNTSCMLPKADVSAPLTAGERIFIELEKRNGRLGKGGGDDVEEG